MNRFIWPYCILILFVLNACEKDETSEILNIDESKDFSGTFITFDSENINGSVYLSVSDSGYYCHTNLPFGYGSGKLKIDETTIDFIDTLFFPIPALYGPSYVLSGKHNYRFNDRYLKIWKKKNVGSIAYYLELITN